MICLHFLLRKSSVFEHTKTPQSRKVPVRKSGVSCKDPRKAFSHYDCFLVLNDTSILWSTVEAVFEDFVDLGVTPVRTSTLLISSADRFAGLACTTKSFVRKEPDDKLIDQVVEGCHALQMLSGLVRRYGEL